jgi:hypothetical protein
MGWDVDPANWRRESRSNNNIHQKADEVIETVMSKL